MTTIDWDVVEHTDVVCPPFTDAACRHCGNNLAEHQPSDPDTPAAPGDASCVADLESAFWDRRPPKQFELADGESLDCENAGSCGVCDVLLCSDHSTEFTTCVENSAVLHHLDCRHTCPDCADAARADARGRS